MQALLRQCNRHVRVLPSHKHLLLSKQAPVHHRQGRQHSRLQFQQQLRRHKCLVCSGSFLDDPIQADPPRAPDPALVNADLLPVPVSKRTFKAVDFAALWVTLVISITTYYLAASLVDMGMAWWQGILTVLAGNLVTLVPMVLNAHPGTKYGLPFPVLARSSFGIKGANLPSLTRALVACAWFGIQTWIGGSSIHQMLLAVWGEAVPSAVIAALDITSTQLACFMAFWTIQVCIVLRGIDTIKDIETCSAPILVALAVALLVWAVSAAGGLGPMLATPSQFGPGMPQEGRFWSVFWPSMTANVSYWASLSLNIPDFSRYAVSQRAQVVGQAVGLPTFMALFSFVGLAVTSATVVIFGSAVRDPVQLLSQLKQPVAVCISLFGLILATLTTNIAANVVAPANAMVNAAPRSLTFTAGGVITALVGLLSMPWKLYDSFLNFLVAYSVVLGPVVGVVLADYYLIRGRQLDIDALFSSSSQGAYWYQGGWNMAALAAVVLGVLPCLPGLLASIGVISSAGPVFALLYDCAWFVGVGVSSVVYCWLMALRPGPASAGGTSVTATT